MTMRLLPLRHIEQVLIAKLVPPDEDEATHFAVGGGGVDETIGGGVGQGEEIGEEGAGGMEFGNGVGGRGYGMGGFGGGGGGGIEGNSSQSQNQQEIFVRPGTGWKGFVARSKLHHNGNTNGGGHGRSFSGGSVHGNGVGGGGAGGGGSLHHPPHPPHIPHHSHNKSNGHGHSINADGNGNGNGNSPPRLNRRKRRSYSHSLSHSLDLVREDERDQRYGYDDSDNEGVNNVDGVGGYTEYPNDANYDSAEGGRGGEYYREYDEATEVLYECRHALMELWGDPLVREVLRKRKVRIEEQPGL